MEHGVELLGDGEGLERRGRVGDGDEAASRSTAAEFLVGFGTEYRVKRHRFDGAA